MARVADFHRLLAPRLTVLVTTMDERGKTDVSTFDFVSPVSFDPPLIMLAVGPKKHSYWSITRVKEFVVNVPTEKILDKVWSAGGPFDPNESKIQKAGLKTEPSDKVRPPKLSECAASIECFVEDARKSGDHIMVIGRVVATHVNEEYLDAKGNLKVDVARPPLHVSENLFAFPYVTKSV
ncbi:MAG: flavin reductase family protein [Candidatus Diapherotrites archaeon]|nr:flavin reductase family protein [Candidatus Diapherotrites archaeon]